MSEWLRANVRERGFAWAIAGLMLLLAPIAGFGGMLATSRSYADDPPSCYGLGFGCQVSPGTAGIIFAVIWAGVAVLAMVGLFITELLWKRSTLARSIAMLSILGIGVGYLAIVYVFA